VVVEAALITSTVASLILLVAVILMSAWLYVAVIVVSSVPRIVSTILVAKLGRRVIFGRALASTAILVVVVRLLSLVGATFTATRLLVMVLLLLLILVMMVGILLTTRVHLVNLSSGLRRSTAHTSVSLGSLRLVVII